MKLLPYFLYLFLLTFHNTVLIELITPFGAAIDITILLVVLVALYKSEEEAVWFAFFAGMISGAANVTAMPYEILMVVLIGAAANQLAIRINLESIVSRVIILAVAVLLHRILITLIITSDQFLYQLVRVILPATLYTIIIGLIFFMIRDGRITWQKTKALF